MPNQLDHIRRRLSVETGTLFGQGRRSVALVYPSPYHIGMSSLGYQRVYGGFNTLPDAFAQRAFLPDEDDDKRGPLLTYESQRPVSDFPVLAFSVAYELEITGLFTCLQRAGVPWLAAERTERDPWVIVGGPLTFSNPAPLGPFADAVVMGEAEELLAPILDALFSGDGRAQVKCRLADIPGVWVPELHEEGMPKVAACDDGLLPATSTILTPETELSNMFLIEPERGCSRGCTFCVMRRSTNGGMRWVPVEKVLACVPDDVKKVGLVGAAVTDHPRIMNIVEALVDSGKRVSLSSLRADRLTPKFVQLLQRGGYRTLTVASDGASERLRDGMEKRIREKHLLQTAEMVREAGIPILKLYMMIGVPSETDADIDELIDFTKRLDEVLGSRCKLAMGIAPFVAKRNTPLDNMPFCGVAEVDRRLKRIRQSLAPAVDVRPTSARWAFVEYCLAQGGMNAGLQAFDAWKAGGSFAHWRRAFSDIEPNPKARHVELPTANRRRLPVLNASMETAHG